MRISSAFITTTLCRGVTSPSPIVVSDIKKKYIESNIVHSSNRQNILAHTITQNSSKNTANFSGIDCCSSSKSSFIDVVIVSLQMSAFDTHTYCKA